MQRYRPDGKVVIIQDRARNPHEYIYTRLAHKHFPDIQIITNDIDQVESAGLGCEGHTPCKA